jgi:hypothetical protein
MELGVNFFAPLFIDKTICFILLKFLFAIRLAKSPLLSNPPSFADVTVVGSAVSRITNSN